MTVGLIICGALAREVRDLVQKHSWNAELIGVPAVDHVFPERIAPHVKERIEQHKDRYQRLIVVYGDCGTKGALDEMLREYPDVEQLTGPHCYEFYGGEKFQEWMEEEPGSYFLTDFMVRTFEGLIKKSMGLDRFPGLKKDYFRNYRRVVFLTQTNKAEYRQRAEEIAEYLELPLTIKPTGYGKLETRLRKLFNEEVQEG